LIDVVATERGLAINPRRTDLIEATRSCGLPIRSIEDLQREVEDLCGGKPVRPPLGDEPVAAIKWVDGTVIDTAWRVG
jgi:citrate lyase subunit alpha/citrate CoA-transferase